ncbi:MAG: redoxin domain-containing protein [Candidatus Bathyarchaeia archaeon]
MGRLRRGDAAPDFTRDSVNMGRVSLGDYRGQNVLLLFSRYFGCPVCQLEFDELLEFRRIRPGLRVVYVNQSLPESARVYIEGRGVDFPVVAAEKSGGRYPLYDLYGVGSLGPVAAVEILFKGRRALQLGKRHGPYEGIETQSPAQFLIDGQGRIASAHYGLFKPEKLQ